MFIGTLFLTDSPRYLVRRGKLDEALKVLSKTRPLAAAKKELAEIKTSFSHRDKHRDSLWQARYMMPVLIVFAVAILNQLTGINSIIQYSAIILKQSGLASDIVDMLGSTLINAINFVMVFIVLLLVDKVGRRILLSIGTAGIIISLSLAGLCYGCLS